MTSHINTSVTVAVLVVFLGLLWTHPSVLADSVQPVTVRTCTVTKQSYHIAYRTVKRSHRYYVRCGWFWLSHCSRHTYFYAIERVKRTRVSYQTRSHCHIPQPDCTAVTYTHYQDTTDCHRYFQCHNNELNHFTCPVGGVWSGNDTRSACVRSYDPGVECGTRIHRPACQIARHIRVTLTVQDNSDHSSPVLKSYSGLVLQSPLYLVMLHFTGSRDDFSFKTTFHKVFWHSVSCINGRCAKGDYYWLVRVNGASITVGVSTFVPEHNDRIMFDYVKYTG